jgi:uncharacterized protein YuzE
LEQNSLIFSVVSNADIGLDRYHLDEVGWRHILLGHADLKNFCAGIEDTVKNPTRIIRSNYNASRLQFVSDNVLSSGGKPMTVVIEMNPPVGTVVTASPRGNIKGKVLWDQTSGLRASYDDRSDIFYISCGGSEPCYSIDDDEDERIWLRFNDLDNKPIGVTIFEAGKLSTDVRKRFAVRAAQFLNMTLEEVNLRMNALLPTPTR